MNSKDIPKCVEVSPRPGLGPRYGSLIKDLPLAIRSALGHDSFIAVAFEESQSSESRFLGAGMAVFINDEFLQRLKTIPSFWILRASSPM